MTPPLTPEQARREARNMLATTNGDSLTAAYAATLRAYADLTDQSVIPMPKSVDYARKMHLLATAYLKAHDPNFRADQADALTRLSEYEKAVEEYFKQIDEHARAMTAAIDAYHTDEFEGETKKAREASVKMDAAEARLRALQEK